VTGALVDLSNADDRQVAAEWLVELLTTRPDAGVRRGVRLRGAEIVGRLDLEAAMLVCPLWLEECQFAAPISLAEADAPAVRLLNCRLIALDAEQLRTRGSFMLDGSHATGEVSLIGAHIGGQLTLAGAKLTNDSGPALNADGLRVDQSMLCDEGFAATGEVRLRAAHIGGAMAFTGARLTNECRRALSADGLRVDQSMFCHEGFAATGMITLIGAHIGGQLTLAGANLTNDSGPALIAERLRVDRDMFCHEGFAATGEVSLIGAHVIGQLTLAGASLTNDSGPALNADGLRVDHRMFCHEGFAATGEVRLRAAHISGQLTLADAKLSNDSGPALNAAGLRVDQRMLCHEGFAATGEIRLRAAHIGGLTFGGTLDGRDVALDLQDAVLGALRLQFTAAPSGVVDLTGARVERFIDRAYHPPQMWARCRLHGCRYDALQAEPEVSVSERLDWLTAADPDEYSPQPYEQLAGVYRSSGNDEAAREVLIAKQRRRQETLGRGAKAWSWFLGKTVGYGYRLWLAGVWLIALAVVGSVLFWQVFDAVANGSGDLTPAKDANQVPPFQPLLYTVDVLLPVVSLGQDSGWNAHGAAQWITAIGTLCGWLLTTALVAGLVIRRG
jgi:adhesin HecA-like repeat protein